MARDTEQEPPYVPYDPDNPTQRPSDPLSNKWPWTPAGTQAAPGAFLPKPAKDAWPGSGGYPANYYRPEEGGLYGSYMDWEKQGQKVPEMTDWATGYFREAATTPQEWEVSLYNNLGTRARTMSDPEEAAFKAYRDMYGQGYSPEELQRMRQANADVTRSALQGGVDSARANMLRTGNTAGGYGAMAKMMGSQGEMAAKGEQDILAQDAALKRQMSQRAAEGMTGLAGVDQARYGQATQLMEALGQQTTGRMQGAAQNVLPYAQLAAAMGQFGTGGLQSLYNTAMGQDQALYNAILQALGTKAEEYTEMGQTNLF